MAQKPILVVMAAGMGSRYGGLKQIDPVGSHGEAILDYSLYDAYRAGFETAVIIIKNAIREEFMQTVGERLKKCPMEIRYAYQELDKLPAGYTLPEGRTKPWGTSHAVLCAREQIGDAPFAVINADDYYGRSAFDDIYNALIHARDGETYNYCMVGYRLDRTITDNGSVTRGVCQVAGSKLVTIHECHRIEKHPGGIRSSEDEGCTWTELAPDTTVSMNLWGFTSSFLREVAERFPAFLDKALVENPMKGEYLLPLVIADLLREGKAQVSVLKSADQWYGVTYAADKPQVMAAIRSMTEAGTYPDGLWN